MALFSPEVAANRFGLGAKKGELQTIAQGPVQWLSKQLVSFQYDNSRWDSEKAIQAVSDFYQAKRKQKNSVNASKADGVADRKKIIKEAIRTSVNTLSHAMQTQDSFQARLIDFFSNHFSVSANNLKMQALAPTLEREAIAANLTGSFYQLLIAVEMHPAMIIYLNNEQSAGPDSKFAQRKKQRGINENLAREILELHTMGVNGGYTQNDVKELAMSITGWSVGNPQRGEKAVFKFRKALHQPGDRFLVGKKYTQQNENQGKQILYDLSIHPSTARFVCFKIARHFIADQPNDDLVKTMTRTWIRSKGLIPEVLKTMIDHPLSWQKEQKKFKTPREFIISAVRACGRWDRSKIGPYAALNLLGQAPFGAGSPAGYGDVSSSWDGGEALVSRIEWADHFSAGFKTDPAMIARNALGSQLSRETQTMIQRAESRQQGLAIFLMSPEFQRR